MIGLDEPSGAIGHATALEHRQRVVDAGAVDIAAQHRASAVIFSNQLVAIIEEPRGTFCAAKIALFLNIVRHAHFRNQL
jgi:hypothetical protein